jgi:hypothetical protein
MRTLDRTIALSLGLLLASVLAPSPAQAQTAQGQQYPAQQPGYQPAPPQPNTPGYPQQQAYPQPGSAQASPQSGSAQVSPQPGSPAQGAPPPGYYPPPAYAAPLSYEPPQSYDLPPTRPAYRRGVIFMPYFSLNSVVGSASAGYSPGFHLGGLLGGHIGPVFSLSGEMALDIMSPKTGNTEFSFDFGLSPLFHFGIPQIEFLIGPKLGIFAFAGSSNGASYSGSGYLYGFTAGVFLPVGRVALGGLFSFTNHSFSDSPCASSDSARCNYSPPSEFITYGVALLI